MTVPRELLVALRSEYRAATGHFLDGFLSDGRSFVRHDTRMHDGSCATCALIVLLDEALAFPDEQEGTPDDVARLRTRDVPAGYAL